MARVYIITVSGTGDNAQSLGRVGKDSDTGEFFVRFYHHTHYLGAAADYHTDDYKDALGTARAEVNSGRVKRAWAQQMVSLDLATSPAELLYAQGILAEAHA